MQHAADNYQAQAVEEVQKTILRFLLKKARHCKMNPQVLEAFERDPNKYIEAFTIELGTLLLVKKDSK